MGRPLDCVKASSARACAAVSHDHGRQRHGHQAKAHRENAVTTMIGFMSPLVFAQSNIYASHEVMAPTAKEKLALLEDPGMVAGGGCRLSCLSPPAGQGLRALPSS
jgi:hypothetical protein